VVFRIFGGELCSVRRVEHRSLVGWFCNIYVTVVLESVWLVEAHCVHPNLQTSDFNLKICVREG
jgi:hypothetical protein